jgi:hypothetical protein
MKRHRFYKYFLTAFTAAVIALSVTFFSFALSRVEHEKALEDKAQLEKAIASAAVSCYAIEGAYPPSVDYLVENYNLSINTKRFTVKYELFASNLMPDITVLENDYEN